MGMDLAPGTMHEALMRLWARVVERSAMPRGSQFLALFESGGSFVAAGEISSLNSYIYPCVQVVICVV